MAGKLFEYAVLHHSKPTKAEEEQGKKPVTTIVVQPTRLIAADEAKALLVAANMHIDDATVGRIRSTHARDLIIEKVDDQQSGMKQEKAVYAVNPTGSADARVVADITLKHQ